MRNETPKETRTMYDYTFEITGYDLLRGLSERTIELFDRLQSGEDTDDKEYWEVSKAYAAAYDVFAKLKTTMVKPKEAGMSQLVEASLT